MSNKQPTYTPTPTCAAFHASVAKVKILIGPVGGSKSSAAVIEFITWALNMPVCSDGIRRFRGLIVRNTYPQLQTTTIKTWKDWLPESKWGRMRESVPIMHHITGKDEHGVMCDFEFYFISLNNTADFAKLLGLEVTGILFDELREIEEGIFRNSIQRVGRYPKKHMPRGVSYRRGIIATTNPPSKNSWLHDAIEKNRPKNWDVFWQPPAMLVDENGDYIPNPDAENIDNLPDGYDYYHDIISNAKNEEDIKVYVLNEYGSTHAGRPCYPQYRAKIHRATKTIEVNPNYQLILGWDFGLDPSLIIAQYVNGCLNVLAEYIGHSISLEDFVDNVVFDALNNERFKGLFTKGSYESYGDAIGGTQRSQVNGQTCVEYLNKRGIKTSPCNTKHYKDVFTRHMSVRHFLTKLNNGKPAFQLDPSCQILHDGFVGGYHYRQITVSGMKQDIEQPEKNKYSHPHDGLQAITLRCFSPAQESANEPQYVFVNGRMMPI